MKTSCVQDRRKTWHALALVDGISKLEASLKTYCGASINIILGTEKREPDCSRCIEAFTIGEPAGPNNSLWKKSDGDSVSWIVPWGDISEKSSKTTNDKPAKKNAKKRNR